jgi:predicted deacylase
MPTRTVEEQPLPAACMGNVRTLKILRYGRRDDGKKAYIQAGLHADEAPGYLVMHHLMDRLDRLDARDAVNGEIVLVPAANPIGVAQWRDEVLHGRFDFFNSINFNRCHPDITAQVAERIKDRLQGTAEANVALIRSAAGEIIAARTPQDEADALKHRLLSLCYDADVVLDLHCDHQAVLHVYIGTPLWPQASDLSAQLGATVTLLAADSGVTPFDEACSRLWWRLAKQFQGFPIPPACLAATVELRGMADLDHRRAAADADNILCFLQRRGWIRGTAPELPELRGAATPLTGVEQVKAPTAGVVVFFKEPGDRVAAGDVVAEVVDPLAPAAGQRVRPVRAATDGILFARSIDRFARPGRIIAKIAGQTALKEEGENLLTL